MRRIIAVIVTMARPRELELLLQALGQQQRRPDAILVVANTPSRETMDLLDRHRAVRTLASQANLGGAGGFAYGILAALAAGATHVWLMDDDGLPLETSCLAALLAASEAQRADVVSPLIVDIENGSRLAFPYRLEGRWAWTRSDMAGVRHLRDFAHLFNGALVRAETFARFGIPDYRLFVRGDEIDFLHRVRRKGGLVLTLTEVAFRHPSGAADIVPLLGGRLHAVVPPDRRKRLHFFRNRGYLLRRHRLVRQALHDVVRYSLYFLLVRRGDWRGLGEWWRLTRNGFREDFRPCESPPGEIAVPVRLAPATSETTAPPR